MIIPVVEEAMKALERDKKQESESYLMAALLMGSAYEHKGDTRSAFEYYSRGLSADPKNDALLILRGMLMYGVNPEAIGWLSFSIGQSTGCCGLPSGNGFATATDAFAHASRNGPSPARATPAPMDRPRKRRRLHSASNR